MKPTYAKSEKSYTSTSVFERKKILLAAKRLKKSRKLPSRIVLEESTLNALKSLAKWRGVPYSVRLRFSANKIGGADDLVPLYSRTRRL